MSNFRRVETKYTAVAAQKVKRLGNRGIAFCVVRGRTICNGTKLGHVKQVMPARSPKNCCKCNPTGRCGNCACVKANKKCCGCLPSRLGHCLNVGITSTHDDDLSSNRSPPACPPAYSIPPARLTLVPGSNNAAPVSNNAAPVSSQQQENGLIMPLAEARPDLPLSLIHI